MTNRPSEILRPLFQEYLEVYRSARGAGPECEAAWLKYWEAGVAILDSHAARLESLERADSPPLSPEAKSSPLRGARFYKRTFPDGSWTVFAIDTACKLWFCLEDGDIRLGVSPDQAKDYTDNPIPYSEAVTLRPAIATRWAEAAPQSEWPSDVVKVFENAVGTRWRLHDDGHMEGCKPRSSIWERMPDATDPYHVSAADFERMIPVIYTRPSPPVQSEQPGKHEGGEVEASGKVGKHECSWCGRRHSNGWHCASEVAAIKAEAIDWKERCIKRGQELTEAGHRIAQLEAELAKCQSKLGTVKDHLTQWNVATTNAAANQAMSNAFNEVTE